MTNLWSKIIKTITKLRNKISNIWQKKIRTKVALFKLKIIQSFFYFFIFFMRVFQKLALIYLFIKKLFSLCLRILKTIWFFLTPIKVRLKSLKLYIKRIIRIIILWTIQVFFKFLIKFIRYSIILLCKILFVPFYYVLNIIYCLKQVRQLKFLSLILCYLIFFPIYVILKSISLIFRIILRCIFYLRNILKSPFQNPQYVVIEPYLKKYHRLNSRVATEKSFQNIINEVEAAAEATAEAKKQEVKSSELKMFLEHINYPEYEPYYKPLLPLIFRLNFSKLNIPYELTSFIKLKRYVYCKLSLMWLIRFDKLLIDSNSLKFFFWLRYTYILILIILLLKYNLYTLDSFFLGTLYLMGPMAYFSLTSYLAFILVTFYCHFSLLDKYLLRESWGVILKTMYFTWEDIPFYEKECRFYFLYGLWIRFLGDFLWGEDVPLGIRDYDSFTPINIHWMISVWGMRVYWNIYDFLADRLGIYALDENVGGYIRYANEGEGIDINWVHKEWWLNKLGHVLIWFIHLFKPNHTYRPGYAVYEVKIAPKYWKKSNKMRHNRYLWWLTIRTQDCKFLQSINKTSAYSWCSLSRKDYGSYYFLKTLKFLGLDNSDNFI